MPSKKRATPISLQPLDALFGTSEETTNGISEIAIGSLHPFPNHPFQVKDKTKILLEKMGFAWKEPDQEIIDNLLDYGKQVGFFD